MDILPSHLRFEGDHNRIDNGGMFSNDLLRVGEVQEIIYPSDPKSVSKKFIEYSVYVQQRSNGTAVTKMYNHCYIANLFGSATDKFTYTLRKSDSAVTGQQKGAFTPGLGAKVLILCINGESHNGVIISGIRDSEFDQSEDPKGTLGHNLHFNFNGVDVVINKDGELIAQYQGKTKDDGTLDPSVSKNAVGTTLTITKDGSFNVKAGNQNVLVDNTNHKIQINSDQEFDLNCNQTVNVTSPSVNVAASAGTSITGAFLKVGTATDSTMKGTTYRSAQAALNEQMGIVFQAIAAAFSGTGGTLPGITAALGAAAGGLTELAAAIQAFEGGSATYLSLKNLSD